MYDNLTILTIPSFFDVTVHIICILFHKTTCLDDFFSSTKLYKYLYIGRSDSSLPCVFSLGLNNTQYNIAFNEYTHISYFHTIGDKYLLY